MSKLKYKSPDQVATAIQENKVKRNSVLVMKRQNKARGNTEYAAMLQEGVDRFDNLGKELYYCSFYKKDINKLTLYELVKLDESYPALFSQFHKVRYSILMLGSRESITEYKGVEITPADFNLY